MTPRAVGIDLGARVAWFVVAERDRSGRWAVVDGGCTDVATSDLAAVCRDAVVAIDAPGGPSEGRHGDDGRVAAKFRAGRCAEVGLCLSGHYVSWVTPPAGPGMKSWMLAGFGVWATAGSTAHEVLEVFPHAVFTELAGRRLPNKQTVSGREARLDVLRGLLTPPSGAGLWGHDAIDAAGAAVVAAHRVDGTARPATCGRHDHAPMWLPAGRG